MPNGSLNLTLDTNVLWDLIVPDRPGHEDASRLFALHQDGQVSIAATTRVDADVRKEPLRSMLDELEVVTNPIGTAFTVGISRLDGGDMIVDENYGQTGQALMDLIFPTADPQGRKHPNRVADIDHLLGHKLNGRDIFITNDGPILRQRKKLADDFGIQVMSPVQFLDSREIC